jgi:signal transduction histidine kinase
VVRLVLDHQADHASQWAAIDSIAGKIGGTAETLRRWVRRAARDEGSRPGPYTARVDAEKLTQVALNLVDNAVKYTPEGSVRVSVGKHGDQSIRICVEDSDTGIDDVTLSRLFEKFSRSAKATAAGSGLGLYVVKMLVEAHGSTVLVRSDGTGSGTTFLVDLPIHNAR